MLRRTVLLLGLALGLSGAQGQRLSSSEYTVVSGTVASGSAAWLGRKPGLSVLDVNWMSTAGGILDATFESINGDILRVDFIPNLVTPPTNNYAVTISNGNGGNSTPLVAAVNLSSATRGSFSVTLKTVGNVHAPASNFGDLNIAVEGAGANKKGSIRLYVLRY